MQTSDGPHEPPQRPDGIADPDHDDPAAAPVDLPVAPDAVPAATPETTAHPNQPGASDD